MIRITMVVMLSMIFVETAWGGSMFRLVWCHDTNNSVALAFRDENTSRRIAFMGSYRELAIERPGEKGLVSWQNIAGIELSKSGDPSHGVMYVRLKPGGRWFGEESIQFGEIDAECWQKLKTRFGADLRFVEHEE